MEPASIRYMNPGAMWGRTGKRPSPDKAVATNAAIPLRWGSRTTVYLNDGTGQGNNIAVFDTWVQGICAQLDLWRSSPLYRNKRIADAIATWSGGNNVESYIKFVLDRVPGVTRNTVLNDAFWQSDAGVAFLKAQAWHEAGKRYPAPDAAWLEARRIVFAGAKREAVKSTVATAAVATAAPAISAAGAYSGWGVVGWAIAAVIAVVVVGGAVLAIKAWNSRDRAAAIKAASPG